MAALGRPVSFSGLSKIERGVRRVEVDDLVALAICLGTSPLALLLPHTREPDETVSLTGADVTSSDAWQWALGTRHLQEDALSDHVDAEVLSAHVALGDYRMTTKPWWIDVSTRVVADGDDAHLRRYVYDTEDANDHILEIGLSDER